MIRTFHTHITNGRINPTDGQAIVSFIRGRKDGVCTFEVATGADVAKRLRSDPQNKYYWGVVVKTYLDAMIDTGDTVVEEVRSSLRLDKLADALHELLKHEFAGCEVIDPNTGEVRQLPRSTAKMTTVEMGVYWDKIRAACLERYGVDIPPPPDDVFAE